MPDDTSQQTIPARISVSLSYWTPTQAALLIGALLFVLLTRLSLPFNAAALDHIDAADFHNIASNLLENGTFSKFAEPPFCPDSVRTPLYPFVLASIYEVFGVGNIAVVFMLQSLLDLIAAAVIFRSLYLLTRQFSWGVIGILCYALSLSQIRFTNEILTEGILPVLVAMTVFFFLRYQRTGSRWNVIGLGVFTGLLILCKPNFQPLIGVFVLAIMLSHDKHLRIPQRLLRAGLVVLVIGLMMVPWYLRNHQVFDEWFYSRTYDDNIARVSAVSTLAYMDNQRIEPWSTEWEARHGELVNEAAVRFDWQGGDTPTCEQIYQRRLDVAVVASEIVRDNPTSFLASHITAVLRSLFPQEQFYWYEYLTGQTWDYALPLQVVWGGWIVAYFAIYGLLVLQVAYRMVRREWALALMLISFLMIGFFLPGALSYVRFRVPIVPVVVIAYVASLSLIYDQLEAIVDKRKSSHISSKPQTD